MLQLTGLSGFHVTVREGTCANIRGQTSWGLVVTEVLL